MISSIIEFFVSYARNTTPIKMLLQMGIFMLTATWIGVVAIITMNFGSILKIWEHYQSEINVAVEDALVVSRQVNDLLQDQRVRLDIDRLYVSRFHNGKRDLTGVHFIFTSRVAEATGSGISNEMTTTQNLPLAIFPTMLKSLANGQCYYVENVENTIENYSLLKEMGVNSMMVCPIFDTNGRLMGILGADGVVNQINTQKAVNLQQNLENLSNVLGGLLTTG